MPRSAETAGSAMLTIVASRITSRTVRAMTPRASHRLGYGSSPTEPAREGRAGVGSVMRGPQGRSGGAPDRGRLRNLVPCDHVHVPVSLVFTSDTHVPKRARDLPHALWAAIDAADVVVHAGDWVDAALLDRLEERSRRLVAVYGNNDHGPLRERLPEVARAQLEGLRM